MVWTQKQLLALGQRLWMEGFSDLSKKDHHLLSSTDISQVDDPFPPSEVIQVLENQESVLQCTRESVKELRVALHEQKNTNKLVDPC